MMEENLEFLRWLSQIRSDSLNSIMLLLTELGNEIVALGIICTLYWCINKRLAYRIGMTFFMSGMLVQALKVSFHIERPWILDPSFSPVEAAKPAATGYSFPSGHTQCATSLYGTFFMRTDKSVIRILCAFLILIVIFTRLYLGVHTPLDVVTSFVVSAVCVFVMDKLITCVERGNSHDIKLCVVFCAISVLICIYSYILAKAGVIDASQINDCFKCGGAGVAFGIGWYIEKNKIDFDEKTDKLWKQALKLLIGIGVALTLKSLPKLIAEGNLAVDFFRYFITVMWVLVAFPLIFSRFSKC